MQEHEPQGGGEPEQPERPSTSIERLREFPPSAKLVLKVIEFDGPLTQSELAVETRLPQRTVREAARRLEETGLVERRVYIPDARQFQYELTGELPARRRSEE